MNAIVDEKLDEARSLLHDEVYWRNSALFGTECGCGVCVIWRSPRCWRGDMRCGEIYD